MDLETENRIAAILLKEAAELRRQAERDGVHVYLQQPKARGRPNSRFLTATVLGVQQANRAVEVNEMWRARQKELELNDRMRGRLKDDRTSSRKYRNTNGSSRSLTERGDDNDNASCTSSRRVAKNYPDTEDEGLRDKEVEEFLHSRVKRGRGSIGSRMDETGPYLATDPDSPRDMTTSLDTKDRVKLGPENPFSLKSCKSAVNEERHEHKRKNDKSSSFDSSDSSSDEELREHRHKKKRKTPSGSSDKKHSRKHKSKEQSRDEKKKKREERRNKRHK